MTTQDNIPTLETERLILRKLTSEDAGAFNAAIHADPEVMKYLPGGVPRPIEQTQALMTAFEQAWHQTGIGGLGIIVKAEHKLIGQCGLWQLTDGKTIEVFYAIAKAYWGQGIVTEAAQAMLTYGFTVAGLQQIIALAWPENTASQRVMQKLSMKPKGLSRQYYDTELALFILDSDDWQTRQNAF